MLLLVLPVMSFLYYSFVYATQCVMVNYYSHSTTPNLTAVFQMFKYHIGSIVFGSIWFPLAEIFRFFYLPFKQSVSNESKLFVFKYELLRARMFGKVFQMRLREQMHEKGLGISAATVDRWLYPSVHF